MIKDPTHRTHSPQSPQAPPLSGIDFVLQAKSLSKGHVSFLYNLLSPINDSSVNKSRADWETELQISISDALWKRELEAVNSSSSCARLSVIQFKVLFRLHYSRDKLFKLRTCNHIFAGKCYSFCVLDRA